MSLSCLPGPPPKTFKIYNWIKLYKKQKQKNKQKTRTLLKAFFKQMFSYFSYNISWLTQGFQGTHRDIYEIKIYLKGF